MNLTKDQIRQYFAARLPKERIAATTQVSVHCAFHDDRNASMSINLEKGVWTCHAGCGGGGLLSFEMKLSQCDQATGWANISELSGCKQASIFAHGHKVAAVYEYRDAVGRLVFEKLRFDVPPGSKQDKYKIRRPDARGGYIGNLDAIEKKPLYHLPEILTADYVIICEGEKDADNVRALGLGTVVHPVAVTTNYDGAAGKWHEWYSWCLAFKQVVILPDNDDAGRRHAEAVAQSVSKYAQSVKVVALPGLLEKQDVSDYLTIHPKDDLLREIREAKYWRPTGNEPRRRVLVSAKEFMDSTPPDLEWLVDGLINRGANGFFCGAPKAGKSWAALDLAVSLSLGTTWMGFNIPRPIKTALIAREDNPGLTRSRVKQLATAKEQSETVHELCAQNLWINTRNQTATFSLDNGEEVMELIDGMKQQGIEFAIFDVFNVLHSSDENDAQQMAKMMAQLSLIQREAGCSIGVVHHYNKSEQGSMIRRLRGSSAIAGWAEWLVGISMVDDDLRIRRMEFETKAAIPPNPLYFNIMETDGTNRIVLVDWTRDGAAETRKRRLV